MKSAELAWERSVFARTRQLGHRGRLDKGPGSARA